MHPNGAADDHSASAPGTESARSSNAFSSGATASANSGNATETRSSRRLQGSIYGTDNDAGDNVTPVPQVLQSLQQTTQVEVRISKLALATRNARSYDWNALSAILNAVPDLTATSAPFAARKVAFDLLESCASQPDLPFERQRSLFITITQPTDSLGFEHQVKALAALTRDGSRVPTHFASDYIVFLNDGLEQQSAAVFDARKRARNDVETQRSQQPRERGLHKLLDLVSGSVTASPQIFAPKSLETLVDRLLVVAERTTSKADMRKAAAAFGSVIRVCGLPVTHLKRCLEVLCAMLNAMPDLKNFYWKDVLFLLATEKSTIDLLFSVLDLAPEDKNSHAVCGALSLLHYLITNNGAQDLPLVSFSELTRRLSRIHLAGRRTKRDCLKVLRNLLADPQTTEEARKADWDDFMVAVFSAARDETVPAHHEAASLGSTQKSKDLSTHDSQTSQVPEEISEQLESLSEVFQAVWPKLREEQHRHVTRFHHQLKDFLPQSSADSFIEMVIRSDLASCETVEHQKKQMEVLHLFALSRDRDSLVACSIIAALHASMPQVWTKRLADHFSSCVALLLEDFPIHPDFQIANSVADFCAAVWKLAHPRDLNQSLNSMWPLLRSSDSLPQFRSERQGSDSTAYGNTVMKRLIEVFIDYLMDSNSDAAILFDFLLHVAREKSLSSTTRIEALDLLTRLRSDVGGTIIIAKKLGADQRTHYLQEGLVSHSAISSSPRDRWSNEASAISRPWRTSGPHLGTRGDQRSPQQAENPSSRSSLPQHSSNPPGSIGARAHQQCSNLCWYDHSQSQPTAIKASEWLLVVIDILQQSGDPDVLGYLLARLPFQLSNLSLFAAAVPHIKHLRNVLTSQLKNGSFSVPPGTSDVTKGDIAAGLVQNLVMLLGYAAYFARGEQDDIVRALLTALSGWDKAAKISIHALALCCHIIPGSLNRSLSSILQKLSQIITQSHLAVDVLEFLGGLARLPELCVNFREDEFRTVFAIAVRYLENSREKRLSLVGIDAASADYTSTRLSQVSMKSSTPTPDSRQADLHRDLPQYVFAFAYHVLTIWFLSLKLADRSNYVGWITRNLMWRDRSGNDRMEEQSQVTLDMMHRTSYLDLGETEPRSPFSASDGKVLTKNWLVGLSVFTVETAVSTGLTKFTKRQASGTTYATYQPNTAPLPPHHAIPAADIVSSIAGSDSRINVFPNHVILQLMSNIAPMPVPLEPICLPDDEATKRSIAAFDLMPTVDGYRVGVVYIGDGQMREAEILSNTQGSDSFEKFLDGLGTKVRLRGATFNTQGLDRESDTDGEYTFAWRDRVVEIVYHVPTLMPTDPEHDPQCILKKRHTGNDFVNIIFNESGLPFDFDTFPSQFNYVNILITPASLFEPASKSPTDGKKREELYYTIQTISRATLPEISPAASLKLLPLSALAGFARQLALHAAVFCNVWANREGGEHVSSWRNRLREIGKLREKFVNTGTSTSTKFPGAKSVKIYAPGDAFRGTVEMGGLADEEGILSSLDFSRWAGPNPPFS